jgi:putative ABC transport system permease protein
MIAFLIKGLLRDRSRSLFPLMTVIAGVALTVLLHGWIKGSESDLIRASASFSTGHVRVMSRAYAAESDQVPNDLAYIGVAALTADLRERHPELVWTPRLRFVGLLDVPDEQGETRTQGPVAGLGIDLLNADSPEYEILNLEHALVRGSLPQKPGEIVISEELAQRLDVEPGETATLISATMYGSLTTYNFHIAGTVRFGVPAMDHGAMLADLSDIQYALDMEDAAGEVLGFYRDFLYRPVQAEAIANTFNARHAGGEDPFGPVMGTLRGESGIGQTLDWAGAISALLIGVFVAVMALVLWNAGLMGSLRRYGEFGVRLAMGEDKGRLYRTLMAESLIIGFVGSLAGTAIGLIATYYLQEKGLNIAPMLKNASMLISSVIRAQITPASYVIGFLPGLLSTLLGSAIAGLGIYRRQTSRLLKELET